MGEHKLPRPEGAGIKIRAHVFVATPTYTGSVAHECAMSMQLATIHCLMRGIVLDWQFAAGFSIIQHGRNWLNAEFLARPECTHLLWLDDDIGFEPDAVAKVLHSLEAKNLDAVGGVYTNKHPTAPMFPYEALGPVVGKLQPARKVPSGFLMVKRDAVIAVAKTCEAYMLMHNGETRESPHVFDIPLVESVNHPGKLELVGEDFIFCQRLLEAGRSIHVRTDIGFMHLGRRAWHGNLAKTLAEEGAAGFTGQGSEDAHRKNQALAAAGAA